MNKQVRVPFVAVIHEERERRLRTDLGSTFEDEWTTGHVLFYPDEYSEAFREAEKSPESRWNCR